MIILNLGCGDKTSDSNEVINIDWSLYLRIRKNPFLRVIASILLKGNRLSKLKTLPKNILVYNLSSGIPYENNSVDVVYHSHFLEHLDRDIAENFLIECKRVLKPEGVLRIVVPDFKVLCEKYLIHFKLCERNPSEENNHEDYIASIIEQCVRKEAYGTSQQGRFRRKIENIFLGDARKRGETHQWMYDRISLKALLLKIGFREIIELDYKTSNVPNWRNYGLDIGLNNQPHKRDSLYIEAIK